MALKLKSDPLFKKADMSDLESEKPYEVEEDESCGRFLVAARDLQMGEEILTEKPTGA